MILYLDTSALVKLYAVEDGSKHVRQAVDSAILVATHLIADIELRAALSRKRQLREITDATLRAALQQAETYWTRFDRLPLDEALLWRAGELVKRPSLRAYDAVHWRPPRRCNSPPAF